jgi:L-rhamnose-H+ transport protein
VVVLWGGLTTNLLWCLYLNWRNRTFGDYRDRSAPLLPNYLLSAAAGSIWFLQFFFYGMGASKLGNGASSWILHMSFIILVSNAWGLLLREWQGTGSRTRAVVLLGIAAILLSVALTGYGDAQLHAE